jgi:hypothetical protein
MISIELFLSYFLRGGNLGNSLHVWCSPFEKLQFDGFAVIMIAFFVFHTALAVLHRPPPVEGHVRSGVNLLSPRLTRL